MGAGESNDEKQTIEGAIGTDRPFEPWPHVEILSALIV